MKKRIIIMGGGNCGWTTAIFLSRKLKKKGIEIVLISSEKIGIIGVGESTVPYVKNFYNNIGFTDEEILKNSNGTYKLGINFKGWSSKGDYLHPFGSEYSLVKSKYQNIPFSAFWNKVYKYKNFDSIVDPYHIAISKNLGPISKIDNKPIIKSYAFHLNSTMLGKFFKKCALKEGVVHVEGQIQNISINKQKLIDEICMKEGGVIKGGLFFDCTGFHSIFSSKYKDNSFISYSKELYCDTALVCRTKRGKLDKISPCTNSVAMKNGWKWEIPLTSYNGNGYIYSSKYMSYKEAKLEFLKSIDKEVITDIKKINFKTGRYQKSWVGNCISMGGSYGFVEPLESTGIFFYCKQLDMFYDIWSQENNNSFSFSNIDIYDYNKKIGKILDYTKDFILFHYYLADGKKSKFWDFYRNSLITKFSESFQKKFFYIKNNGLNHNFNRLSSNFSQYSYSRVLNGSSREKLSFGTEINKGSLVFFLNAIIRKKEKNKNIINELKEHKHILYKIFSGKD